MRPRPALRWTLKWGAGMACVLTLLLGIGSRWVHCYWSTRESFVCIGVGCLVVGDNRSAWGGPLLRPGFRAMRMDDPPAYRWWFGWDHNPGRSLWAPLWVFAVLLAGAGALAWRLEAVAREHAHRLCPKCGYDRRGIDAASVCPECGAAAPAAPAPPAPPAAG